MLKISSGKVNRPLKVVLYGPEGIGKSTLASEFPNPLFIDTEGGTSHMDVQRIENLTSWDELLSAIVEVAKEHGICGTLVLDTADWAEQMCVTAVCNRYKKAGVEEFGYGKGYTYLSEEFSRLLSVLDEVIAAGIHVVVTAHAKMRKFEQPDEMGAYDRWEMKLSKQVAPLIKEWCDELLFLNYKTFVASTVSNTKKAQGGKRVMYATHHPCWDAKNRHGLPDEIEMDYGNIAALFEKAPATPTVAPLDTLKAQLAAANITDAALLQFVTAKGYQKDAASLTDYPDSFITDWVLKYWNQIVTAITADAANNNKNGGSENE